jgi:hypothetical protein
MTIFRYAKVHNWSTRVAQLGAMAEPERWGYQHIAGTCPLPVLDNYLQNTFARAQVQNKILESERSACFNTGLLTPGHEELFGLFRVNRNFDPRRAASRENKKWFLSEWGRSGNQQLTEFTSMPSLVTYWKDPSELIFDPSLRVDPNVDHIVRDNLDRFPEELTGRLGPRRISGGVSPDMHKEAGEPTSRIAAATPVSLATRNALEGAIRSSIRLAQRNYRIAVPQFYRDRI